MQQNLITRWLLTTCALASAMLIATATLAQPPHDHAEPVVEPAKTYAECISRLAAQSAAIERALASGDKSAVDTAAYTIAELAKTLGKVALTDASVSKEKVKAANLTGKEIATEAGEVHEAAEAGKLDEAKSHFGHLKPLIDKLTSGGATAPAPPEKFVCEMHCEGTKLYDAPGTCPICKMDLTALSKTPFYAKITAPGSVEAGKPVTIEIRLLDPTGNAVKNLDVVHEFPLHFMLMSEDLSFYSHEHPTRRADGVFMLNSFTFPFGGKFIVYSDFTPTGASNQVSKSEFTVPAGAIPKHEPVKLVSNYDGIGSSGDYEFRVRCNGSEFFAGQDSFLRYGIDLNHKPVADLQPLMGAMGHLVIVSADFKHFVHAHPLPLGAAAKQASPAGGGGEHAGHSHESPELMAKAKDMLLGNGTDSDVIFHAVFPEPGWYRAFAQFQHKGKVLTYAVSMEVKPNPGGAVPAAPAPGHDHTGHTPAAPAPAPAGGK